MKKITKDMTFAEIFKENSNSGLILMQKGLMCGGCPMAQMETLEQGCIGHGIDVKEILEEINKPEKKDE